MRREEQEEEHESTLARKGMSVDLSKLINSSHSSSLAIVYTFVAWVTGFVVNGDIFAKLN